MSKRSGTRYVKTTKKRTLRRWLLNEFGDGLTAPCAFCGTPLDNETLTVDHYPIPARDGGRWRKGNIRPACASCNHADGRRHEQVRYSTGSWSS